MEATKTRSGENKPPMNADAHRLDSEFRLDPSIGVYRRLPRLGGSFHPTSWLSIPDSGLRRNNANISSVSDFILAD